MTDQRIVYTRPDGGVSVVVPGDKPIEELLISDVPPDAINPRVVTTDKIPSDRTFREAWTDEHPTETVDVDLTRAKALWLDRWRAARSPLLAALDVESTRALEDGDKAKQAEIKAKKQALRDVTKTDLSAADTPEKLKSIWPEVLGPTQ